MLAKSSLICVINEIFWQYEYFLQKRLRFCCWAVMLYDGFPKLNGIFIFPCQSLKKIRTCLYTVHMVREVLELEFGGQCLDFLQFSFKQHPLKELKERNFFLLTMLPSENLNTFYRIYLNQKLRAGTQRKSDVRSGGQ